MVSDKNNFFSIVRSHPAKEMFKQIDCFLFIF